MCYGAEGLIMLYFVICGKINKNLQPMLCLICMQMSSTQSDSIFVREWCCTSGSHCHLMEAYRMCVMSWKQVWI